jgi:hypothetical protein
MTDTASFSTLISAPETPLITGDWSSGFDADTQALVAAKGWRSPEDALKSYANLERLMGGEKIALPGADAPTEAWDAVYARLGRPAKAEDYAFDKPEGLASYSDELASGFRKAAHAAGLSARQAATLHDFYIGQAHERMAAEAEAADAASEELAVDLRRRWGADYDGKLALARRAARTFAPGNSLDRLEASIEAPALMSLFARIGEAMGEDRLTGDGGGHFAPSFDDARTEIARIEGQMTNPKSPLMDRAHPEHDSVIRRRDALYRLAFPG